MANSDKDILISPRKNQSAEPEISFTGFNNQPISLRVLDDNTIAFQGANGQVFSISNNLTDGIIFSASDISGVPGISLDADGIVQLAPFVGKVGVGSPIPKATLEVAGADQAPGSAANTSTPEPTFRVTNISGGDSRFTLDFGVYQGGGYSWIRGTTRNNLQAAHNIAIQPTDQSGATVSIGQTSTETNARLHVKTRAIGASSVAAIFDSGTEFDASTSVLIRNRCSAFGRTQLDLYGRTQANNSAYLNPRNEIRWFRSYTSTYGGAIEPDTFAFRDGVELTQNVRFIGNSQNTVNFAINQSNKVYIGASAAPDFSTGGVNWGGINGSYQSNAEVLSTRHFVGESFWAPGVSNNYATSRSWTVGNGDAIGHYQGNFSSNGSASEQSREWFDTPNHGRGIVWRCLNNDAGSNDDGGWNKGLYGVNPEKAYRSIVWVRRNSTSGNGTFYHGCDGGTTAYLNGNAEGNPYFNCRGISSLEQGVWYLSVGYIHAYSDTSTQTFGGLYDSRTGLKIQEYSSTSGNCSTEYKWSRTDTPRQVIRCYLYYSTDSAAALEFWGTRFEEVNGEELSIGALLGLNTDRPSYLKGLRVGGVDNGTATFSRTQFEDPGLGGTDAVGYFRDASNADWGIIIEKSTFDYGMFIATGSGTYALTTYNRQLGDYRFRVNGIGQIHSDQSTSISTGADYAEYFEWEDGNPNNEDRTGFTVTLVNDKIKICSEDEIPMGVVSATPAIIGDSRDFYWSGKYLTDNLGRLITNKIESWKWVDEDGKDQIYKKSEKLPEGIYLPDDANTVFVDEPIFNPDWDSNENYIPRSERKEWACIGLMGKLRIYKNQIKSNNWIKMKDIDVDIEMWLIK